MKIIEIKNVEIEKMLSGALLLLISLSCALISPLVVIACFAVLVLGIGAILRPRFALLVLFMGAGLPSITLPLPGHNMHLVEPITVLVFLVIIVYRPSAHFSIPHLLGMLFLAFAIISFIHVPELVGDSSPYAADKRLVALLITIAAFFAGTWLANTV